MSDKVIIVGGVAGGASTAARLRRLDETAEIILLERGEYISYANCGLPYYIGGAIEKRNSLFVMKKERFNEWFNVDVRVMNEAISIDRTNRQVEILNHLTGEKYWESYDYLVLSPGAEPIRPPLPGIDSPGIFSLRTVDDTDRIYNFIAEKHPSTATVIGGGFIGLEMAENLHSRGICVTVVELAPQVLPPIDPEMAAIAQQYLRTMGVKLRLGDGVKQFHLSESGTLGVELASGTKLQTDMVILSIGVKPELRLAQDAGLEVNRGIKVNEYLQTTDPRIYALGDAIEVTHLITGKPAVIPLAGPANKQGRIVANNIAGRRDHYKGTQGTAVLKIFNMTVALTGANERTLKEAGLEFHSCIIHPNNHAGYYPGASPLALKLLFAPDGKILGSQIVGFSGVEKRIDVIATALRLGNSVYDLQELELAYAPPYSSAKDPVNMAGYVASNVLLGDLKIVTASELLDSVDGNIMLLDVREPEEYTLGQIPGAVNIPLGQLRKRLGELDPEQEMIVYCAVGLRSYLASRILVQNGFNRVRNLSGGYRIFQVLQQELSNEGKATEMPSENNFRQQASSINPDETIKLDLCGLQCPGPIMQIFLKMNELSEGAVLEVCCTDPGFSSDIASWCLRTNNTLLSKGHDSRGYTAVLRKGITAAARSHTPSTIENDKTIVVFSGDLDRALAALIIANGAAAMGRKVTLFFTFWGLNILRKSEYVAVKKPFMDRMFGAMMPRGSKKLGLSRMNMLGMGPKMIRMVMKNKNVDSLELLLKQALAVGVRLVACQMSMDIMGITSEELIDGVELAGVASYLDAAESSDVNLFI